ncbi:hypothetical protein [Desulfitobacterium metallireducens]|uniref:Nitrite reductase n=1 Tax=Desulfitobacterium metallireducens DSM 15288 TaxID=871968 RepID=W0E918_9FIRM|nr:hypothetical protein [Desulfitobacterium metallireducens]AHF07365.1 nitrite reductase [Desulfitobacterium metallireducens DSM 15288]
MSLELENKEKMIKTCQAILDSCEKPFVWEEADTSEIKDYRKPFNLLFPQQQIESELYTLLEKFSNSKYLYDQITATCTLDAEWFETGTYGLDRNENMYFKRYILKPEYVAQLKSYFINRINELQG